jgi:hypothetical protein
MNFVAVCSDGEYVSVPHCAVKHCQFFALLKESLEDNFWLVRESPVPYVEPQSDPPASQPERRIRLKIRP